MSAIPFAESRDFLFKLAGRTTLDGGTLKDLNKFERETTTKWGEGITRDKKKRR